jgi:cell wall-associated NlpC family hydrolase
MSNENLQIRREDIEREANALVNVPFRHQGDDPRFGIDCRGVLLTIAARLGYTPSQEYRKDYSKTPDAAEFRAALAGELDPIEVSALQRGDAPLLWVPKETEPRHVGVIVSGQYELMIIHATEKAGRVIKEPWRKWERFAVEGFRFRGLIYG